MIKQGVLNFLRNLKYYFTPLGTLALGLIFGLSVLIPGIASAITTLVEDVKAVLSDSTIDLTALKDCIYAAVRELDWNEPLEAIRIMFGGDWIMQTLDSCVGAFVSGTEAYTEGFSTAVSVFTQSVVACIFVTIVFLFLGFIGGFFLSRWLVRRDIARRTLWKFLLNTLLDAVVTATLVAFCVWLVSVWKPSIIISTIISIVLFEFIALLEAYVVHALGKVSFGRIINIKNLLKLIATDMIIFAMAFVGIFIAIVVTNQTVGIFMGVVLMEIAFIVVGLNAEAYTVSVVNAAEPARS